MRRLRQRHHFISQKTSSQMWLFWKGFAFFHGSIYREGMVAAMDNRNWGNIRLCLKEQMESRGMTRYRLHKLTGIKYEIIDRYYKAVQVERVDLLIMTKICCILQCQVEDLLKYEQD